MGPSLAIAFWSRPGRSWSSWTPASACWTSAIAASLHAGDAFFDRREMDLRRPRCKPGLRYYQVQMEVDRKQRLGNQRRLRELLRRHGDDVRVICAHDPVQFEQWAQRSPEEPAVAVPSESAVLAPQA